MLKYFAHGGETHDSVVEASTHVLGVDSPTFSILVIAVAIAIPVLIQVLVNKPAVAFLVAMVELLLIGVLMYSFAPGLSVIAIVLGFALSLGAVLLSAQN